MIDRLRVMESYMPDSAIDCYGEMPLAVVKRRRLPFSLALKVVLPEEVSSSLMQQPALTNLFQQMLQLASNQSDCSQVLTDIAACLGSAFSVDGCAIAFSKSADATAQVVYWLADAPPLHRHQLKNMPALFKDWYADAVAISVNSVETVEAHHTTTLNTREFLEIWQLIVSLQASSTGHCPSRYDNARSRSREWSY